MALNQAETFEWMRQRIAALESQLAAAKADLKSQCLYTVAAVEKAEELRTALAAKEAEVAELKGATPFSTQPPNAKDRYGKQ